MTEMLPPPPPTKSAAPSLAVWIITATLVILIVVGAGGYKLYQQIDALRTAKPEAPREVTDALTTLRTNLDQQRTDTARRLQALQAELGALKEQQAAAPAPDLSASIAPLQEKLDALAARMDQSPAPPPASASAPDPSPLPAVEAVPDEPAPPPADSFSDLRSKVTSGAPYAMELALLKPQLPTHLSSAVATLERFAEAGVPSAQQLRAQQLHEAEPAPLPDWAQKANARLASMVRITPSKPGISADQEKELLAAQEAREAALVALATIEAGRR